MRPDTGTRSRWQGSDESYARCQEALGLYRAVLAEGGAAEEPSCCAEEESAALLALQQAVGAAAKGTYAIGAVLLDEHGLVVAEGAPRVSVSQRCGPQRAPCARGREEGGICWNRHHHCRSQQTEPLLARAATTFLGTNTSPVW